MEAEWEDDAQNKTVYQMKDEWRDKEEKVKPAGPEKNPRYEFQPHVKSLDFEFREVVRIGRHMK